MFPKTLLVKTVLGTLPVLVAGTALGFEMLFLTEEAGTGLGFITDFGLPGLGLSGFTLTCRRLVPKLLTAGEVFLETGGCGILMPIPRCSSVDIN